MLLRLLGCGDVSGVHSELGAIDSIRDHDARNAELKSRPPTDPRSLVMRMLASEFVDAAERESSHLQS